MDNHYLMHYGVKGMKWGIRKDRIEKAFKPGPKGRPSAAETTTRASNDILGSTKRIVSRKKKRPKQDYSHISNSELQKRINRLQMEKRYSELTEPGYSRRKERVLDFLDVAGDFMAIGASAAVIGTQVYKIRHM